MHKYDERRAKIRKRRKKNFFPRRGEYPSACAFYLPSLCAFASANNSLTYKSTGTERYEKNVQNFFLDNKPGHVYTDYGY
jgi:hypothetical protein